MRLGSLPILAVAIAVIGAGCSSSGASPSAAPAGASPAGPPATGPREIAVRLTDALRFEPAAFEIRAGETIRFVVTNAGKIRHEFFVGDEDAQRDHEQAMRSMGMAHDEPNGISVEPGRTEALEIAFAAAGDLLIGCHEPGHYEGGMKATIAVRG